LGAISTFIEPCFVGHPGKGIGNLFQKQHIRTVTLTKTSVKDEIKAWLRSIYIKMRYVLFYKHSTRTYIGHLLKKNVPMRLEIGAGYKKGTNGWITLDMNKTCDLYWDLRDGIPFPDNSIEAIYSSHLFEHLTYQQILGLLKESKRVLKPGGTFSICVPNARPYIEAYLNNDRTFWNNIPAFYEPALGGNAGLDMVNYIAYMDGEHKYLFDQENLMEVLKVSGFNNVRPRGFDPELDMKGRDYESVYAIANK
jgi:predicted SAM-dependent methyltransferase